MTTGNQTGATNLPEPTAPKVFVSHASEDKQRFVLRFAEALRLKGIDAWVDKWEILPGDSLVDKIFEEGLKNATGVIIVLSKNSVDKPWVREELNASVVQRIANKTKIIPVVIDECEIPAALKSTVWERIGDLEQFQAELDRIVSAIFGNRARPPLGPPPAYLNQPVIAISGLTGLDNLVLKAVCEEVLAGDYSRTSPDEVYRRTDLLQIGREDVLDSLEVLDNRGYLKISRALSGPRGISHFKPTMFGFENFAKVYVEHYRDLVRSVALKILNLDHRDSEVIAHAIGVRRYIVDHILEKFASNGFITLSRTMAESRHVITVSPELKRAFS